MNTNPIFGLACEMPKNMLPTNLQVAQHFMFIKGRKNESNRYHYNVVSDSIIDLWQKASIPIIQKLSVQKRVKSIILTGSELCRSKSSSIRIVTFKDTLNNLFDIAACKCKIFYNDSAKEMSISCICPRKSKIPHGELSFIYDQRNMRHMFIGGVDQQTSKCLTKRLYRNTCGNMKAKRSKQLPIVSNESDIYKSDASDCSRNLELGCISFESDDDAKQQMRIRLPNVAKEADRYGVSDRAVASIINAALIDFGMIDDMDQSLIIDKNKVHRERDRLRKILHRNSKSSIGSLKGIYFDGKKDRTLDRTLNGVKLYCDTVMEEHYILVSQPGGEYLTHVTPKNGGSECIADIILTSIKDMGAQDTVSVIGCDSTNVNTGCNGGVIRRLEKSLGRPLQWFICMMHTNELPLRHLFSRLDGTTSGACSFAGSIGKEIQCNELKPVVNFNRIVCQNEMPVIEFDVLRDLSCDQKYLYEVIMAIRNGAVSIDLSQRKPGALNHSRWLTLANRICRLYISSANPSSELCILTHFIVSNYGPNWFAIKRDSQCTHGAKCIFLAVQLAKELSPDTFAIVKPYISRNAYFAHVENILICMLADTNLDRRSKAVDIILQCREAGRFSNNAIRQFRVPTINFSAIDYVDLIDWKEVYEPPITMNLTNEDIKHLKDVPISLDYSNNTQCVERCVQLVSDASKSVYGFEARDGFIRARICSRKLMPKFDSKQDYSQNFL